MKRRHMLAVLVVGVLAIAVISFAATPWWRAERALNQLANNPSEPLALRDQLALDQFIQGHWRYRPPWRRITDEEGFMLTWAAIDQTANVDDYMLRVVLQAHEQGNPVFSDLVDSVAHAVNQQIPGAAGALHETRAQLGRPRLDDLDLESIADADDISLIIVCIIAYDDDDIRKHRAAFDRMLDRPDLPSRARERLLQILQ